MKRNISVPVFDPLTLQTNDDGFLDTAPYDGALLYGTEFGCECADGDGRHAKCQLSGVLQLRDRYRTGGF